MLLKTVEDDTARVPRSCMNASTVSAGYIPTINARQLTRQQMQGLQRCACGVSGSEAVSCGTSSYTGWSIRSPRPSSRPPYQRRTVRHSLRVHTGDRTKTHGTSTGCDPPATRNTAVNLMPSSGVKSQLLCSTASARKILTSRFGFVLDNSSSRTAWSFPGLRP